MKMDWLTVAAHPDDELLGLGGTIRKWAQFSGRGGAIILATGLASRGETTREQIDALRQNTRDAAKIIGYEEVHFGDFPDNRMDGVDLLDVIKFILPVIEAYQPKVIFTHNGGDLNIDHEITYRAVMTAARPNVTNSVKKILAFETPSSTEYAFPYRKNAFAPNVFYDITDTLDHKLQAMACYKSELQKYPGPRSLEKLKALAEYRGQTIGVKYAEAFEVIWEIGRI